MNELYRILRALLGDANLSRQNLRARDLYLHAHMPKI